MGKKRVVLLIISILLVVTSLPVYAAPTDSVTGLQVNQLPSVASTKQTIAAYANGQKATITYSDVCYIDGTKKRPFAFQIDLPNNFSNLTASITSKSLGHTYSWGYDCTASSSSSSTDNKTWYFYFDFKNAADLKTDTSITDIIVSVTNGSTTFKTTLPSVTFKQIKEETKTPFIQQNSIENEIRVGIPANEVRNNIKNAYIKIVNSENKTIAESSTSKPVTNSVYTYYRYENIFGTSIFNDLGLDYIEFTASTAKKAEFTPGKYSIYLSFNYDTTSGSSTVTNTYQKTIPDAITITSDAVVSEVTNYSGYPKPTYSNNEFFMVLKGYGIDGSKIGVKYVDGSNNVVAESVEEKCLEANQLGLRALTYKIQFKTGMSFVSGKDYYTVLIDKVNNKEIRCGNTYIEKNPNFYSVSYDVTKPYAVFYFKGVNIKTEYYTFTLTDKDNKVLSTLSQGVYGNDFTVDLSVNNTVKLYKNNSYYISCATSGSTRYVTIDTGNYGFDDPNMQNPITLKSSKYIYSDSNKLKISANFNKAYNVTKGNISIKFVKNDKGVSTVLATTNSAILTPYSAQYTDGSVDEGVNVSTELNWPSQTLYLSCTYKVIAVITNAGQSKEVEVGTIKSISPYIGFIDIPAYYYDNAVFYFNNSKIYCEFDLLKNNGITPDWNSLSFSLSNSYDNSIIQLQNANIRMVRETEDSVRYLMTADLPGSIYKSTYLLIIKDLKTGKNIDPGNTFLKDSYLSAANIKNTLKTKISSSGETAVYGFSVNDHETAPDTLTMRLYDVCNINNRRDITNMSCQSITVNKDIIEGNNSYCLKKDDLNGIDLTKRYNIVIVYNGEEIGVCSETLIAAKPVIKVEYASISPNNPKKIKSGTIRDINIWPLNANSQNISFSSSNSNVVSFNEHNQLIANGSGNATVTISSQDGEFTCSYEVTVSDLFGDVDGNGKVEKADASIVLASLNSGSILSSVQAEFADMNNDNEITPADVTLILKKVLGK